VLRVLHESETVVQAGEPLIEIGDPTDLEVVVDLPSSEAVRIQAGAAVIIEAWGGDQALSGRVRQIEPSAFTKISALGIEEQRVNVIIDLTDPPAARRALGHGFRVLARVVVYAADSALLVPAGALFREGRTGRCSSPRTAAPACARSRSAPTTAARRKSPRACPKASASSSIPTTALPTACASRRAADGQAAASDAVDRDQWR
jgi:hypothetical protein